MKFLAELRAGDARLGGKARSLAELASAGLPTPVGFVVSDDLFRALCPEIPAFDRIDEEALAHLDRLREQIGRRPWPAGFHDELRARVSMLPAGRFAVRSSFASEDRPGRLAAGVYESRVDLPVDSLEPAIRDVLRSALAPGAVAYALANGDAPSRGPFAVLVHAYLAGSAEGSAAMARGGVGAAGQALVTVRRGVLPVEARADLCSALAGLAASRGPVEVEWVLGEGRVVYLQARPFDSSPAPAEWAGWVQLGESESRDPWHWDAGHNPLPLSPAQAGLVELVDRTCSVGIRQRVLGGYLFCARDDRPLPFAIPCEEAQGFFLLLRSAVESRLAALGVKPGLDAALEVFLFAYQPIFGVLQPALRENHRRLHDFLAAHAPPAGLATLATLRTGVPSRASERLALSARMARAVTRQARERAIEDYLAQFGDESACWDVAAPTYAEEPFAPPARLAEGALPAHDWQRASKEVEGRLDSALRGQWRDLLHLSRVSVALGEDDDWLYAQAQAAVRRALLGVGERLVMDGALADRADVFYLPLPLARDIAGGAAASPGLASLAAEGRKSWQAACGDPPPLPGVGEGKAVHGTGTGGRAIGRVLRHRPGSRSPGAAPAVLVARTILPTELPLLAAAAIVSETGGPLDHVAAQARERGIPAVVGAIGAMTTLAEGELVLVDGDRGLVVRLG